MVSPTLIVRFVCYSFIIALILLVKCAHAEGQTSRQIALIKAESLKYDIDPNLALAVAEVESKFDSAAIGALGEVGLFQLRPKFFPKAVGASEATNIRLGVRYLADCRRLCRRALGVDAWVNCFNQGPLGAKQIQDPTATDYYKKVIAIYNVRRKGGADAR